MRSGKEKLVQILLGKGANVNSIDDYGDSVLIAAALDSKHRLGNTKLVVFTHFFEIKKTNVITNLISISSHRKCTDSENTHRKWGRHQLLQP